MYGKKGNKAVKYSLFNLPNPYDYNIVKLIHDRKEIIEDSRLSSEADGQYLDFLKEYFLPIPGIYLKKRKDADDLSAVSKKYDTGKPKTFEELLKENEEFRSLETKEFIYNIRKNSSQSNDSIDFLLGNGKIEQIINKLDDQSSTEPLKAVNTVYEEVLNKFSVSDFIGYVQKNSISQTNIDPVAALSDLPVIELFDKIDYLPKPVKDKIYGDLKNTQTLNELGIKDDFLSILTTLEDYSNLTQIRIFKIMKVMN